MFAISWMKTASVARQTSPKLRAPSKRRTHTALSRLIAITTALTPVARWTKRPAAPLVMVSRRTYAITAVQIGGDPADGGRDVLGYWTRSNRIPKESRPE